MKVHETRVVAMVTLPMHEPLYTEEATRAEVLDEAGGEFLQVSQGGCESFEVKEGE